MKISATRWAHIVCFFFAGSVAACGGSGGSESSSTQPPPPSATAQTTLGQITAFGSVYVNGVEFDTAGASYDVDDTTGSSDDDLAVGMVVKIDGSVNADGRTGQASSISYDDDVEGIVENLATDAADVNIKTFSIMGISVRADSNNTNFEGEDDPNFSFDTIMDGDNVEVSGEFDGDVLIASYIEKQDSFDDDFEAKGTVDQYNGSDQFVLILRNESTLNVTLAAGASIPSAGIVDGQYVEVEGTIPDPVNAPTSMLATKVELEDHDRIDDDDEDETEIKGILSYDADTETWSVKNVALAFDDSTQYSPENLRDAIADRSAAGLYVEVEGQYSDDVLQVDEIELEEDELEFKADVSDISVTEPRDGTVTLSFGNATGTVEVRVTPDTMFRDDDAMDHYDLNSLMIGDKVAIEARLADDGIIYASSLHLEDDLEFEIKGTLDAIDDLSITVLGVVFTIDANTVFEHGVPTVGDYVEIEDDNGNGVADSVEKED
ncbi:DUF5666 domain-containing protein [Symmachiella dynata]|uniref:DUF5666 domain-containing protein n=1 Tax=Symmachiella dynata TaxID=2527995 RepID=UPI0030ECB368